MAPTVVTGLDGSPESRAAAEWAAREAVLRGLSLTVVTVREPLPAPVARAPFPGFDTGQQWDERQWSEQIAREAAEGLRARHPGLDVGTVQADGEAATALAEAARDAELLVLGSRGLGALGGFLVGSVGRHLLTRAEPPVVMVRAGEQATDEHLPDPVGIPSTATPYRPVLLGVDLRHPHDEAIRFAFDAARLRGTSLHVLHCWVMPPWFAYGRPADPEFTTSLGRQYLADLYDVLRPWKQKYPDIEVLPETREGKPAAHLADVSRGASLVVVGRLIRRSPLGPHTGPVTQAVLHHCTAPVAVVAHD